MGKTEMQLTLQAENHVFQLHVWPLMGTLQVSQSKPIGCNKQGVEISHGAGPSFLPWKRRCEGWTFRNHRRQWSVPTVVVDTHASELEDGLSQGP